MDVNLNSVMRLSMAARPLLMRSKGSILNFASMLSYLADDSVPAYWREQDRILGLTRALAHRFGPAGVRVNAIAPGYHETDMTKALWSEPVAAEQDRGQGRVQTLGNGRGSRRRGDFPLLPCRAFVTATTLPVDGGYVVSGF